MDHFLYRDGVLHAEDVPLTEIAAAVGTPVYVYSAATLTRHFKLFDEGLAEVGRVGVEGVGWQLARASGEQAVLRRDVEGFAQHALVTETDGELEVEEVALARAATRVDLRGSELLVAR